MPCYTVNLVSVEFKVSNEGLLKQAAESLKWSYTRSGNLAYVGNVRLYLDLGKAEGRQAEINTLKRAYGQSAVKAAAKAKGWTLDSWKDQAEIRSTVATKF